MNQIIIAASSSNGLSLIKFKDNPEVIKKFSTEQVKSFSFSIDGNYFAISHSKRFEIYETKSLVLKHKFDWENISKITFSPLNNYVVAFEHYRDAPNMRFIDLKKGDIIKEVTQQNSGLWRPQWSCDESICIRFSQGDLLLHSNNDFSKTSGILKMKEINSISLNEFSKNPRIAICVLSKGSSPSYVRIHSLQNGSIGSSLVNKTFFGSDEVSFFWSHSGNDLIVLATKLDSTTSYYGQQNLYFLTTKKDGSSCNITLPKAGQIHDIKFIPDQALTPETKNKFLFVICYGAMPSRVSVFGPDCEIKYDIGGGGSFNHISFNRQANLIMLAGFGNIPANVSIWNFRKKQRLSAFNCNDVTSFSWLDDGQHFVGSTTTPKLRVNNGFSIYHYDGNEKFRWNVEMRDVIKPATFDLPEQTRHELYHVLCQPLPKDYKAADFQPVKGIIQVESLGNNQAEELSKATAYVPPSLRGKDGSRKAEENLTGKMKNLDVNNKNQKSNNKNAKQPGKKPAQNKK